MKLGKVKEKLNPKLYSVLEKSMDEFRPCQTKAIEAGVLKGESVLVCSPTASGKTLVAELAALSQVLNNKQKCVYIVPLKSLATEKYDDFKAKYEPLGVRTAISIGDLDSSDPWLENYDIIITTSEKLDSLIRHGARWLKMVGTVVVDEIHLMNDPGRGPTLEILLTLLNQILPNLQLVGLSATIGNPEELAEWLDAKLVEDSWRPVQLFHGTHLSNNIDFYDEKDSQKIVTKVSDPTLSISLNTIANGKQALVFCSTKSIAESTAEKLSALLESTKETKEIADQVTSCVSPATQQCKRLGAIVSKGVAFHHSGLVQKQKKIVEDNFRKEKIKVICCTPTLAAGVNLPAFRTIIKNLKRYAGKMGTDWIPVLEYHQMSGRAGRPGQAPFGEAITLAKSDDEKQFIHEKYVLGLPEDITSKLSDELVLRTAALSLIGAGFIRKVDSLIDFFKGSFYGYQYKSDWGFQIRLEEAIDTLIAYGFIQKVGEKLEPTRLGKRISELYIDPDTAFKIVQGLKEISSGTTDFSLLHLITYTPEMSPGLSIRKADHEWVEEELVEKEDQFLCDVPKDWDLHRDRFVRAFKLSLMLQDWIDERSEQHILEKFNVRPGELNYQVRTAEWLMYGCFEITRLLGKMDYLSEVNRVRYRMKYGVKEELMPLVKLKGIGRYRARKLHNAGIKNIRDIKRAEMNKLKLLIGDKTAEKVVAQIA